jgi:hypothetical protein
MQGFWQFILDLTFLVAHWDFAFEYFKIARRMPYVVEEKTIPEDMIRRQRIVNSLI